jgi:hypothetical protein
MEIVPTELEMKTQNKQKALHQLYSQVIGSVSFPVEVHSRQEPLDLTEYIRTLGTTQDDLEEVVESYKSYCQHLNTADVLQTRHYVVVRTSRNTASGVIPSFGGEDDGIPEELEDELDNRCRHIQNTLNSSELEAQRVTGDWLEELADEIQPEPGDTESYRYPANTEGSYSRTVALTEFPSELRVGWPLDLMRLPGKINVTQSIKPQNPGKTANKLDHQLEKAEAEIKSFLAGGFLGVNKLEQQKSDINWMLDMLSRRSDTAVKHSVYITVEAETKDECDDAFDKVTGRLDAMRIGYKEPVFKTDHARKTTSLHSGDQLKQTRLMPSSSAAAGFPFGTARTSYRSGVIYGTDTTDGTPVLLNRFAWSSHSMAIMGLTGSGKSYLAKLEILRSYLAYPNVSIAVFDPKKEYSEIVKALGGVITVQGPNETVEVRDHSPSGQQARIASFEVEQRGESHNVNTLIEGVRTMYQEASNFDGRSLVFLDEARILLNDSEGCDLLNQFVLEGRDTETAITMLSQNASHFTHNRKGREILSNIPGKILMQHLDEEISQSMIDYFNLSNMEVQSLNNLKTGTDSPYSEGLLKVANRIDTKISVESTPEEHRVIESEGNETENKATGRVDA